MGEALELMDAIRIRLVCGCLVTLGSADEAPICTTHSERRVSAVKAPPPRFRAVNCDVRGAHVQKVSE